jgi:pyrroloquinoline-quinone synthase
MSEKPAPWTKEEFEQKLRDKEALYHINHPFHKLMHSGKLN